MRRVTPRLGWLAMLALAGCIGAKPAPPDYLATQGRMSSAALFDPARFGGDWRVIRSGAGGCAGAQQSWRFDGAQTYALSGVDCSGARPAVLEGTAVVTGPGGRLMARGAAYQSKPVWLLWVDQDYRIAVLGTPDGSFAVVLARESVAARGDLTRAALEVLDFNGYDLGKLPE